MEYRDITDKSIWESFIGTYCPTALFQSWNWGEVIRREQSGAGPGAYARRIGMYDRSTLVGIASVAGVRARRGRFLHIRHGPVLSNGSYLTPWTEYTRQEAKQWGASFFRISPQIPDSRENKMLYVSTGYRDAPIHAMDSEYCWVLDLEPGEDMILKGMRKTTRYLVRQAEKRDVSIRISRSQKDLDAFFELYRMTADRHHFVPHSGIRDEFNIFLGDDQALLFQGYSQNTLVSMAIVLFYHHQAIYHHSASQEQKVPVNYLLQWRIIQEAIKRNMKIYNFWGIAPLEKPRHPWKGLTVFKTGFGGRVVSYRHAMDYVVSPLYYPGWIWEMTRKIRKGY